MRLLSKDIEYPDYFPDRAESLLRDEFFVEVVKIQLQMYIDSILESDESDIEARERALVKHRAVKEFVASIESIAKQRLIDKKRMKFF